MNSEPKSVRQKPIKEGLFHQPQSPHDNPYLIGSRCDLCGYVAFPKRVICPTCLKEGTMKETRLSTRGKINTFTISHVAPLGFKAPYVQSWVDLPEGPRVFSMITGVEPVEEALHIGMEVELVIDKIRDDEDGTEIIGYKFRPVQKAK